MAVVGYGEGKKNVFVGDSSRVRCSSGGKGEVVGNANAVRKRVSSRCSWRCLKAKKSEVGS